MEGGQTNPRRGRSQPRRRDIVAVVQRRLAVTLAVAALLAPSPAIAGEASAPRTPAQVVRAWSRALNASDDKHAGALFALGAIVIQGPYVVVLKTTKSAVVWNSGLPCSGVILRIRVKGSVAVATFRLGQRPGHKCDGPGQLAAAKFTVRHGRIVRWEQVAPETGSLTA